MKIIQSGMLIVFIFFAFSSVRADSFLALPQYIPIEDKALIHGKLESAGSTTLNPILEAWLEDFSRIYPDVSFTLSAKGSGSAPKALMAGTANLGAMSRPIKDKEIKAFNDLKYYEPTEIRVAKDALGIIVSQFNPLNSISLKQLDAIYSKNRKCGYPQAINEWAELGWDTPMPMGVHFFDPNAGGSGFFREKTLCGGEYRENKLPYHNTSKEMAEAIGERHFSIGFTSMTKMNSRVKTLKVSKSKQHPAFAPNATHIPSGDYHFTRYLYIYVDKRPGSKLPLHVREFVKYVLSRQGQRTALQKGSFPLSPTEIGGQLGHLLN